MAKVIIGIEANKKWTYEGRSGVSSYLYCQEDEKQNKTGDNGYYFKGAHIERVKLPNSISPDIFKPGDRINVFYNRFGSCEAVNPA